MTTRRKVADMGMLVDQQLLSQLDPDNQHVIAFKNLMGKDGRLRYYIPPQPSFKQRNFNAHYTMAMEGMKIADEVTESLLYYCCIPALGNAFITVDYPDIADVVATFKSADKWRQACWQRYSKFRGPHPTILSISKARRMAVSKINKHEQLTEDEWARTHPTIKRPFSQRLTDEHLDEIIAHLFDAGVPTVSIHDTGFTIECSHDRVLDVGGFVATLKTALPMRVKFTVSNRLIVV